MSETEPFFDVDNIKEIGNEMYIYLAKASAKNSDGIRDYIDGASGDPEIVRLITEYVHVFRLWLQAENGDQVQLMVYGDDDKDGNMFIAEMCETSAFTDTSYVDPAYLKLPTFDEIMAMPEEL